MEAAAGRAQHFPLGGDAQFYATPDGSPHEGLSKSKKLFCIWKEGLIRGAALDHDHSWLDTF